MCRVDESDCFQKKSAEVRMPSVQVGLEARSYMRLAYGRLNLLVRWVVNHGS